MNHFAFRSLALACCLATVAACSRQPDPAPAAGAEPTTALGGVVKKATDEARRKLATENLDVGGDNGNLPRAQISPQGDLLIDGKAVAINDRQRALLLAHRGHIIDIAEAGIAIGVQGADLGMKAASEALKGIFSGDTESIEKRMQAEGKKMEAEAMKLCERMPAMLASQNALAAAVPEFKPYATMDQSDVDNCNHDGNNTYAAGKDVGGALARAVKDAKAASTGQDAADAADAAAESAAK